MATAKTEPTSPASSQLYGVFLIVAGGFLIGIMSTSAKLAYEDGANAMAVLLFRSIFGGLGLAAYLVARGQRLRIESSHLKASLFAGLTHAGCAVGMLASLAYIDVSLASVILFTFPFIVAAMNHVRGVSALNAVVLGTMVFAVAGLILTLGVSFENVNFFGVAIAGFGAVAIAIMVLTVADFSNQVGALQGNLHMILWATVYFAIAAVVLPLTGLFDPMFLPKSLLGWVAIAATGLTFTFGYVFFFISAQIIGTTRASVLSILEPVMMIALAMAVLGERLSLIQSIGMALVLGSLLAMELYQARRR